MKGFIECQNNWIHPSAVINWEAVEIGQKNVILPFAVIGFPGFIREATHPEGKVVIGDNNRIGCHVSIMTGEEGITQIGHNNAIMNYANIGHNVTIGDDNEIGVRVILAGWATLGDGNQIKLDCNVRNRVSIGNQNVIGMGSNVTKNFNLDGKLIYGNPAKIVRDVKPLSN